MHHIIELALAAKAKRADIKQAPTERTQRTATSPVAQCESCNYQNNYYGDQVCDRA